MTVTHPELEVVIERPVAGGRMLARSDRGVVLVAGAIPGERVRVAIERTTRHVSWARVVAVLDPSEDRRTPPSDPACGGLDYAHVAYDRQRRLKGEVVTDAFRRIGRMDIGRDVDVAASPEIGYRMRARLHHRDGRIGFFRERTHELCDAGATGQLQAGTLGAVSALLDRLADADAVGSVIVAENVAATERVLHLEPRDGAAIEPDGPPMLPPGVTGVTTWQDDGVRLLAGEARVRDTAVDVFGAACPEGLSPETLWARTAASFFQGNRFLLGPLVAHVLGKLRGGRVGDAYAGVGLFAVAAAAAGRQVLAIEGDRDSAADLMVNAKSWTGLHVEWGPVEHVLVRAKRGVFDTLVVDPPRSGLSPAALAAIQRLEPGRVVYVSCDVATLARDASRLVETGWSLGDLRAFDLFPNTGHVETVAVFDRG